MTYASAIEACSRMISGRAANSSAARRISAPLLNIVLGAGAEECLETIRQSYPGLLVRCGGPAVLAENRGLHG